MYALVDANSFYCSAEQVFRPEWRGRPIVVLSNNDGCIVAANRQAKALGVGKFGPYFEVRDFCEKAGVIALSSNYELYASLSHSMMEVIGRFAPEQHIYSIDESFLSFKHCYPAIPCLLSHAAMIRRAVWKETRLPVCVGIAATLTLAKVANHAAKKLQGYNGVCYIQSIEQRNAILATMKVTDVWGIGSRIGNKLHAMGITTALDLAKLQPGIARSQFSIEIERTVRELNGEACKGWDSARADKQQIFSTRSVGERISDIDSLLQALSKHAGIAAAKARKQGSVASTILIFASNSPYDEQPNGFKYHYRCAYPTNDNREIISYAAEIARKLYNPNTRYYKIGIGLLDLSPVKHLQTDLFAPVKDPALMQVFDKLNQRYGSDAIFVAAQGIGGKWHMRRELLTPQYTSCWQDIPQIHCG
ncbi:MULTISPECIES: Y-family DNA polymerase [unclassified Shewanella]|uniref:Y-family DNA polymerase n=1 Tax=unclassified Shewanella TaxID=196818 RepID=UPI000C843C3E|nr:MULTISPECIES: Y-family DNA polymerase [unclassified Shewanella]MDO6620125.1 Y-family DNA polymerase [Shewanella sp. 6_MG-2023]MDO6640535.1 Y-family DNA polymerase [Shewanella sp. 5_MG-2023]PMG28495.1 DNA polymerase V subunit UmuC [Shewanella sp. 10N.286.52.C2]PMG43287.1 DNA polymerase V subunit UmuC [Shewanella sp. 10N.286.52.B9]PMH85570.1 DNA polymerase V subunit UmuC [Shewanella sp. 10N.286.48.B5]